ncbi:MAG: NUDIX domain-containing protein [Planctomycetota bacterium]|nr:MAG: NUDIX domain-containing protein [Planctomycetota bacterium]
MDDSSTTSIQAVRPRGVVAVVMRAERFLVIRRSAEVVAPGKYCFPGGGIEGSETESEALKREFREELGAAIEPVRCVWRSSTPWMVDLAWWLSRMDADTKLVANPAEVESVHWLSGDEMLALAELLDSNRTFLAALAERQIRLD